MILVKWSKLSSGLLVLKCAVLSNKHEWYDLWNHHQLNWANPIKLTEFMTNVLVIQLFLHWNFIFQHKIITTFTYQIWFSVVHSLQMSFSYFESFNLIILLEISNITNVSMTFMNSILEILLNLSEILLNLSVMSIHVWALLKILSFISSLYTFTHHFSYTFLTCSLFIIPKFITHKSLSFFLVFS